MDFDDFRQEVSGIPISDIDKWYTIAKELLIHEFRTLSERNGSFLIVQTILLGAVGLLIQKMLSSVIFDLEQTITWWLIFTLAIFGIAFCEINIRSGQNGAEQASFWRNYMRALEYRNEPTGKPWNTLFDLYGKCVADCNGFGCKNCALKRTPYPFVWLIYPTLFTVMWLLVLTGLVIKYFIMVRLGWLSFAMATIWIFYFICVWNRMNAWVRTGAENTGAP